MKRTKKTADRLSRGEVFKHSRILITVGNSGKRIKINGKYSRRIPLTRQEFLEKKSKHETTHNNRTIEGLSRTTKPLSTDDNEPRTYLD